MRTTEIGKTSPAAYRGSLYQMTSGNMAYQAHLSQEKRSVSPDGAHGPPDI